MSSSSNIVLGITIRADGTAEVRRELGGVSEELGNVGNAANGANRMFADMAGKLKGLFAGIGLATFANEVLKVNREMQSLRASMEVVTGSAKNASIAFTAIQDFAVKTPYGVEEVTEAFIKLKTLGLDPSERALTSYGNTAGAMGKSLNDMIEAVADAATGEFERLKEFGIRASSEKDRVTFTFKGISKTVKNSSDEIQNYLLKLGESDFASGMEIKAKTMDGAISNLSDSWNAFMDNLLDDVSENLIAKWVSGAADALSRFDVWINGAVRATDKLAEIDHKIAAARASIAAHEANGAIGGLIDDLAGYDVNLKRNQIDLLNKEREKVIKLIDGERETMENLVKTQTDSNKATEKASTETKKHANAEANRREAVADTIAALQFELEVNRMSRAEQALQTKLRQSLAKAVGIEREQIKALVEQIHAENAARETQKAMWEALIADANALDKLKDDAGDAVRLANLAEELKLQGLNNQAIKDRIDLEKQFASAIAENPDLDPEQVKRYVAERAAAEQRLQQLTDVGSKSSADSMETAFKRAIENIQDSFADMFEDMLNGETLTSFENFADNIRKTLHKAISQQLALDLQNLFTGKGGIGALVQSGLVFAAGMVGSLFSRDTPARNLSPAEIRNSPVIGTGAMHIADSFGRDLGLNYQSKVVADFNKSLNYLTSTIMDSSNNFASWISSLGDKLASASVVQSVAGFFKPVTTLIGKGMDFISGIYEKLTGLISKGVSAISNVVGLGTGAATAGTSGAANAGLASMQNVAGALAVLKLGFDLYETWAADGLTTHKKITNSLWALSDTLLSGAAIYGNWIMAAGAAVLNFGGVISDVIENGFNSENFGRLLLGPLSGLIFKQRTPNAWMNTYNPGPGPYAQGGGTYTATGNKSAYIGESTAFGMTVISTHELSLTTDEMVNAFGELLKTVKTVDGKLYNSINRIDEKFGQAGKTIEYYNRLLGDGNQGVTSIATKQDASELNAGNMLLERYAWVIDRLAESGTAAGQAVNAWFDVITNKFITTSRDNAIMVLGIIDSLGSNLEDFMAFPLALVDLIGNSVKSVSQGGTPDTVMKEIAGILDAFVMVKSAFSMANMSVDQNRIAGFLANINAIGYGVNDAAQNLIAYGIALHKAGRLIGRSGDQLMATVEGKFNSLKSQGMDNAQINAFFGSFGLFANLFSESKVAFSESDLDTAAQNIHRLASASVEAAKNTIDHAIATEKLADVSRESAIATLLAAGKIEEKIVAEAEYGLSVQKATKDLLDAMSFIQRVGFITGQSLGEMGVSASTWQAAAKNVINIFGDLEKAMQTFDGIAKTFLSASEYALYNLATIDRSLANMREANPHLAGLNESSIAAALKSGEAMADFINQMAQGSGELAKTTLDYVQLVGKRITVEKELADAYEQNLKAEKERVEAYEQRLKTVKNAIDQVNTQFSRLNGSELQSQLWGIQDSFLSTISTVISNGGKLADIMTVVDIALKTGSDALDKAKANLKSTFDGIYSAIGQARTGVSDAIVALTNKSDLQRIQKERAWADLNSSNYETQMAAVTTLQNLIMQGYDEQTAAVEQIASSIKQLKSYVDGLKVDSRLSPLSNQGRLDESRSQFNAQLALARAGDKDALSNISRFADSYLGEAQNFYASSTAYADIFANVTEALSGLTQSPSLTPEQQTAEATKNAVDELKSINAVLDTIQKQQEEAQAAQLSKMGSDAQSIKQNFLDALYEVEGASAVLTKDLVANILSLRSELADLIMNIDFTTNLPEDLQNLMVMASNQFKVSVDLVLDPASTLTPEEKAIAIGMTKNSVAKLALLLDPASTLTQHEKAIATTSLMNSAVLLNMAIDPKSTLTEAEKMIAIGTAHTYQALVDIQLSSAYDATAKALALATENTINTAVKVLLDPSYDSEAKQIAIATANSINAAVKVALDPASSPEAKALALNSINMLNAAVKAVMDPASSLEAKTLALNSINALNTAVKVALDPASSPEAKALALNSINALNAWVKLLLDPASTLTSEEKAIATTAMTNSTVLLRMAIDPKSTWTDAEKRIATDTVHTYQTLLDIQLSDTYDAVAKALALATENTINTAVKVVFDPGYDSEAKQIAVATATSINTAVKVALDPASSQEAKTLALNTINALNAEVKAVMNPASSESAKALALNHINSINASVKAYLDPSTGAEAKAIALNNLNKISTSVIAQFGAQNNTQAQLIALAAAKGGTASLKVSSTLTLDAVLNNSILSYSKKDVAWVYNRIADGVWAIYDQLASAKNRNSPFVVTSRNTGSGSLAMFAKGGVTNKPSIFGEAGWEAAVPLPDGRTIPVTVNSAPTPTATSKETEQLLREVLAELKAANRQRGQIATATLKQANKATQQAEAQTRAMKRAETA